MLYPRYIFPVLYVMLLISHGILYTLPINVFTMKRIVVFLLRGGVIRLLRQRISHGLVHLAFVLRRPYP
jgi:hypothetical protein